MIPQNHPLDFLKTPFLKSLHEQYTIFIGFMSRSHLIYQVSNFARSIGGVAELVGIEGGVVSGVFNLESSGVEASDWRPRHDEPYHEA